MTFSLSNLVGHLKAGAALSVEDVLAVRRRIWNDGNVSPFEAEAIFELNRLVSDPPPEWVDFFVEAMTDYVVNRQPPRGYVSEENAAWLIARVDLDGRLDTLTELELLVKVIETALNAPPSLKAYALHQIEEAVLGGDGPTRCGGHLRPGVIDDAEIAYLRRLMFASGGDNALSIGRDEADLLWRLKEATLGQANAPGWADFFVQAVGNHLMAYSAYRPLEYADAARLDAFVADTRKDVAGFIVRMAHSLTAPKKWCQDVLGDSAIIAEDRQARARAEHAITSEESAWLKARIDADATLDPLEKALLAFIAERDGERD